MHRVFVRPPAAAPDASLDKLRASLRALDLEEVAVGESYLYMCRGPRGDRRQFLTLQGGRHSATVYLYPDALGREPGAATAFYHHLDDAGLGMGSKAGP